MAGGSASAVAPRALRLKSPMRGDCSERGVSRGLAASTTLWAPSRRISGVRSTPRSTAAAARSAARGTKSGTRPSWSERTISRAAPRAARRGPRASGISRSSPVSCGTRAIRRPQYGLRGLWSQTRMRPPGRATRTISASVRRTSPGSAMWCRRRHAQHEVEAVVVERQRGARPLHRHDAGRARAQDLEHPRGRVDPGHRRSRRARAAPPSTPVPQPTSSALPARAVLDHVARPLAQVVLDDVRRAATRRRARRSRQSGSCSCASSPAAGRATVKAGGRTRRRGLRRRIAQDQLQHPQPDADRRPAGCR